MSTPRAPVSAAAHCFVVPPLAGPISGGTLYNRELLTALSGLLNVRSFELSDPVLGAALGAATSVWVDSLYLGSVPDLRRRTPGRLALIAHYLPSFVALGRAASSSELSDAERDALGGVDACLVTSAFMRDALEALVVPNEKSILTVEPGTRAELATIPLETRAELCAVMIGNVVPGKGIEPWLRALEAVLSEGDGVRLSIIGSLSADPEYARRCRRLVEQAPLLAERVRFLGALSPSDALAELGRSELFVSASRMESYGIALNEARVVGVPILARTGGNATAHADPDAGGELVADDDELARRCVALARDPELRRARVSKARARAPLGRSWLTTAREFSDYLAMWEK
jgi:glycosyltransferase involved in cell wall biosynthesis